MKAMIFALGTLISVSAQAAAPEVSCQYEYRKVDQQGNLVDHTYVSDISPGPRAAKKVEIRGITFSVSLSQICAVGFGSSCVDAFSLGTGFTKGEVDSFQSVYVEPITNDEYYTSLKIGKESVSARCRVTPIQK